MPKTVVVAALILAAGVLMSGCVRPVPKEAAIDYFVKGQMLMDSGDVDAALAELAKAIKIDPDLSIAYAAMGDIHRHRGSWGLARTSYEAACQTNPYAFRAHYNLALSYQTLAGQAIGAVEKVRELLEKAVETYLKAIAIESTDFDANLNISACYFELGQADKAEEYCKIAVEIDPSSAAAYSNLGTIQDYQDKLYEAVKSYKASLEQDARQPELLVRLASAYMRQGRLKAAIETLQNAAAEDPSSSVPWEKIGACYFYDRNFDKAQEAYAKALALNPASAAAHRGMGVAYMSQFIMNRDRVDLRDKALEEWNTSLDINPDQDDLKRLVKKYTPAYEEPKL